MSYMQLFSDALSIITISTCFILKVPQIINIVKLGSAQGISLIGLTMELFNYTVMFSYNYQSGYAVLLYLEYPVILIQEFILIACVMYYKKCFNMYGILAIIFYFLMAGSCVAGIFPKGFLVYLVPLCTPIGGSSKVVQLVEILRSKNSESVSVLTWFISAFTNFTRVFTISIDSADTALLLNFVTHVLLSLAVMIAAYVYKPVKTRTE